MTTPGREEHRDSATAVNGFSTHASSLGRFTIVTVTGEVDMATAGSLREVLDSATARPDCELVLDLRQVTFMDSTGLGALAAARRHLSEGARLRIVADQPVISRLFHLAGMTAVFPTFLSVAEATR